MNRILQPTTIIAEIAVKELSPKYFWIRYENPIVSNNFPSDPKEK